MDFGQVLLGLKLSSTLSFGTIKGDEHVALVFLSPGKKILPWGLAGNFNGLVSHSLRVHQSYM